MLARIGDGWWRYGSALVFAAVAVEARWLLDPWLGDLQALCTLYGAVAVAVWYSGRGPALLITALGFLVCNTLFVEPRGAFAIKGVGDVVGALAYLTSCLAIIGFATGLRTAQQRAEIIAGEARARQRQLRVESSERRRAEAALGRSQEHFRVAQELSLDGFTILETVRDQQGRITDFVRTYVNPVAARLLGGTPSGLMGRRLLEGGGDAPRRELFDRYVRVVETGQPFDLELTHGPEVSPRWVRHAAVKLGDGVAVSFIDITPRKQAEAALKEADRRKDEFLATLAHELRNPLAPIRNAVHLLRLKGADDPHVQRSHDLIDRQVQQLTRLVDDLLDVSRIGRGKVQLRKERVALPEAVERAAEMARPLIDAAGHELTVELPPEPLYLDADPSRLAQVLANLLNNAAKYTPAGGHLRLVAGRAEGLATIQVEDDGMGISPELLPHVFEMYAQGERAVERAQGGLGLGLAIVKQLVEMHGGSISAASAGPGRGSTFTVHWPLAAAPAPPPHRENGHVPAPAALRVLVVDDNRDAAASLADLLRYQGHQVTTAFDGPEALQAARDQRPAVVLLDLGMPGMSGHEVARHLRDLPEGRAATLIAVTGWGQDEDRRRSREAGFDHHLVKPVEPEALARLLGGAAVAPARG